MERLDLAHWRTIPPITSGSMQRTGLAIVGSAKFQVVDLSLRQRCQTKKKLTFDNRNLTSEGYVARLGGNQPKRCDRGGSYVGYAHTYTRRTLNRPHGAQTRAMRCEAPKCGERRDTPPLSARSAPRHRRGSITAGRQRCARRYQSARPGLPVNINARTVVRYARRIVEVRSGTCATRQVPSTQ